MSVEHLDEVVRLQKQGKTRGIVSICSAHPFVINTSIRRAARAGVPVVVESTCNQVNQFGGYTGITPAVFAAVVHETAEHNGLAAERIVLSGDHLGPSAWQNEPAENAMQKAEALVRACVQAGYVKLHLDASMKLGGDEPSRPLDVGIAARRMARLAKAAEAVANPQPAYRPRYVIGTEVPPPGGATEHEGRVHVTTVADARWTLEVTRTAFVEAGMESAWERVIALVVQPGVEFGDDFVQDYDPAAARDLVRFSETIPLVYEAHSTDYQTRQALRDLVRDHFAILKVGPALTFAYREAIFALAMMENEIIPGRQRSCLIETMDRVMRRAPQHWQSYYHGSTEAQAFTRKYSLSDRIRYYWAEPQVWEALERLFANLRRVSLPNTLLSQYLPVEYEKVRAGRLESTPEALVLSRIERVLEDYAHACGDIENG
jgi:D-tagatose-1,6-bisphosphate aldolase subunit GatZ/KbaZ